MTAIITLWLSTTLRYGGHKHKYQRGFHPLGQSYPYSLDLCVFNQPGEAFWPRYWHLRFRSPLLAESRLIRIPPVIKMFQFTGLFCIFGFP